MRYVVAFTALLATCAHATVYIVPRDAVPAFMLGHSIGGAIRSAIEVAEEKGNFTEKLRAARARFWAEYPKGKHHVEAETEF